MQQDTRFAVCAHVATWAAHYSAFRRGFVERRLIADFVEFGAANHPLRLHAANGLGTTDVSQLFESLGFRTNTYVIPGAGRASSIPPLRLEHIPRARELRAALDEIFPPVQGEQQQYTSELAVDAYNYCLRPDAEEDERSRVLPWAHELVELVVDELVAPFIRSLNPVYAATYDHALLVCGRSDGENGLIYYFHDDQLGPYLAAPGILAISRAELLDQTVVSQSFEDPFANVQELTMEMVPGDNAINVVAAARAGEYESDDRAVITLVVACPPRALLQPADAIEHATRYLGKVATIAHDGTAAGRVGDGARVTLVPGLDYKRDRREQARSGGDSAARKAFSSVQLAEWVVLVEGDIHQDAAGLSSCRWEVVYDASSGGSEPRVQLFRAGTQVVAEYPGERGGPEQVSVTCGRFNLMSVRLRSPKTGGGHW